MAGLVTPPRLNGDALHADAERGRRLVIVNMAAMASLFLLAHEPAFRGPEAPGLTQVV